MVCDIIRQVLSEMGVTNLNSALSRNHVHTFVEISPHVSVSATLFAAPKEFEHTRKRYWGQRFWQHHFSTTFRNITDDTITRYLDRQTHKEGFGLAA